jgi:hypothetical protein
MDSRVLRFLTNYWLEENGQLHCLTSLYPGRRQSGISFIVTGLPVRQFACGCKEKSYLYREPNTGPVAKINEDADT